MTIGFAELVEQLASGRADGVQLIRAGLPSALLDEAAAYFELPPARMRALAGLSLHASRSLSSRRAALDVLASERLWRLADVAAVARAAFPDEAAARAWLRTPHPVFAHSAPLDWLDTEPGGHAVRRVLADMAAARAAGGRA
jgi:putative toxin-antitoxin system antitoxin component (TIGR02293 family)